MRAPTAIELSGLWKALDLVERVSIRETQSLIAMRMLDDNDKAEIEAAIEWLKRNQPLKPRVELT